MADDWDEPMPTTSEPWWITLVILATISAVAVVLVVVL